MQRISQKVYETDKGLWNTIKKWFEDLVTKLKKLFGDLDPQSENGRIVREMGDRLDSVRQMWADMVVEVGAITTESTQEQVKKSRKDLEKLDADYLSAVERGDMETAQQMVYDAAKQAGYTDDMSYKMQHSAPNSKDDVSLYDLKKSGLVPNDYWDHPEWYTYGAEERESFYKIKDALSKQERWDAEGKTSYNGKPAEAKIWVYRAVDKTVNSKEDHFRNGDWVTPSYNYAVNEGQMNPNGYRIIKKSVSIKDLYWDGNSIAELGYDDGNNYAYRDTVNNRKLLDPVTYDDYGQVIPLSKRFKYRNSDTRYSHKNSVDNFAEKDYNLFTATDEYYQKVTKKDQESFPRKLANKTSDISQGEIRTVTIYCPQKIYVFEANGYMRGDIITSYFSDSTHTRTSEVKNYVRNNINEDREIDDSWSKGLSYRGERYRNYSDSLGGGVGAAADDRLSNSQSTSDSAGYTERIRSTYETNEETSRILKELKEKYGIRDEEMPKYDGEDYSYERFSRKTVDPITSREELAKALTKVAKGEDRAIVESYKANVNLIKGETARLESLRKEIDEIKYKKSITYEGRELSVKEFEQIAYTRAEETGIEAERVKFKEQSLYKKDHDKKS